MRLSSGKKRYVTASITPAGGPEQTRGVPAKIARARKCKRECKFKVPEGSEQREQLAEVLKRPAELDAANKGVRR
jgi:hypothetical protein